jgi:hypothetical protein
MDTMTIREGSIGFKTFSGDIRGRFDSRSKSVLYVSLEDHLGVFYKEKLTGSLEEMNEALEDMEIVLSYENTIKCG